MRAVWTGQWLSPCRVNAQILAWYGLRSGHQKPVHPQWWQQQWWQWVPSGVRVGAAVVLQVPGLSELPGAQVALEGPDTRVDLDVPVAVTVARKRLATHAAAEGPVPEVLCLVQAVLQPVVAREGAVATGVAATMPHEGLAVATVGPQLARRRQGLPAPRAADLLALATIRWGGGSHLGCTLPPLTPGQPHICQPHSIS